VLPPLVLLAAGRSRRMGSPKGLVDAGGRTLLELQLERYAAAGGRAVALVLGADAAHYAAAVAAPCDAEVRVVINPEPERGPFSSFQCGARALAADAVFVLPIDCPGPGPATWAQLAAARTPGVDAVTPLAPDGRGGHPILLGGALLRELAALDPEDPASRLDYVLRDLAARAPERLRRVAAADPSVSLNLNDAAALERWLAAGKPRRESD
jgi:CTP:molybdopterin cytidylyltransferase MocA